MSEQNIYLSPVIAGMAPDLRPKPLPACASCPVSVWMQMRSNVTARLLPRWLCLEAGSEVGIVDEVIEKLVPGLGRETGLAEHVSEFIYTVIG